MKVGELDSEHDICKASVLVFAPSFPPALKAGGPARSISNLVSEVSDRYDVNVITPDRDLGAKEPFPSLPGGITDHNGASVTYVNFGRLKELFQVFRGATNRDWDLVLLNSFWHPRLSFLPVVLRRLGLLVTDQLVLMPRGELDSAALGVKARKKRVAVNIYRWLYLSAVDAFGVTSENERISIERLFKDTSVLLTTNSPDRIAFSSEVPAGAYDGKTRLIFLGRIHPHKGLVEFIRGLRETEHSFDVDIVGPVEDSSYWSQCSAEIARLPDSVRVNYVGVVSRQDLPELLHSSDAMVSLTAGENYGHTIAESLQAGCPVLASDTTPWTDALVQGGGWVVEERQNASKVASALTAVASMDASERELSRRRARQAFEAWERTKPEDIISAAIRRGTT